MEYKDKQILSVEDFCASNIIDDTKRSEGLVTPSDIERFDNIFYGPDKDVNYLDVYLPKNRAVRLPVIVSIHGGGWVYGNKDIMQFYCMSLAQKGFAVINFSYRLAPKYKHPAPFIDTNSVFRWVFSNAEKYHLDANNVFAVGDSVGANILALYSCACIDKSYAERLGVDIPDGFLPNAVGLNCGIYHMKRGEVDALLDSFAEEYFPSRGTDEEYEDICVSSHLGTTFPPAFIVTAQGDFLSGQAKPFFDLLKSKNAEPVYRFYGDKEHELKHVFHIDIKLAEARRCNEDECNFFKEHLKKQRMTNMTQLERMEHGLIYDTCDEEIQKKQAAIKDRLWELNQLKPSQVEEKKAYLKEVFAECGEHCFIETPFRATWGGIHVHFGNRIYANYNLTLVDDGHIYVGDRVLFAPNVTVVTANHTLEPELRRYEMQYVRDVHIGENTWICTGAIILPGVTIGKNCIIGAGSVVTRDIPDNCLAVGNPCRVLREIREYDREYYFHGDRIDWENLETYIDNKRKEWNEDDHH